MDNPGEITEILRLCRLCLVKDQVNIPIFDEQGDIRQIFLKISSCLPVKVSREDQLPKKICDGCSNKLDLLYEFWNTSANAEKTLLSWLGQAGVKDADETISAVAQQIAKPVEIPEVKEETEPLEDGQVPSHATDSFPVPSSFDEGNTDEAEAPPPKRARRTAAVKAQINLAPESDDDEDDDMDNAEPMTKMEDESDESEGEEKDPSYSEVPGTSADDQAGPSGVGKDGVEAPYTVVEKITFITETDADYYTSETDHSYAVNYNSIENEFIDSDLKEIGDELTTIPSYNSQLSIVTKKDNKKRKSRKGPRSKTIPYSQINGNNTENLYESGTLPLFAKNMGPNKRASLLKPPRRKPGRVPSNVPRRREHLCEICGEILLYSSNLNRHLRNHEGPILWVCHICGKSLSAFHMKEHMEMHTGVKRHKCTLCEKVFRHSHTLKWHITCFHEKKKLFQCDICKAKFTRKYSLTFHVMKKHNIEHDENYDEGVEEKEEFGEIYSVCLICNMEFENEDSLAQHYLQEHETLHLTQEMEVEER